MTPVGSLGDVNPFLAVGRELASRGHEVFVLTAEPHGERVRRAGLGFVAIGTREDYERSLYHPDLWHPRRGVRVVMDGIVRSLDAVLAALSEVHRPGRTVLVGHTLAYATRIFEELHDVPAATVHLAPVAVRSLYDPPVLPPRLRIGWMPRWLQRGFWWGADRFAVNPWVLPGLNACRVRLGLPEVREVFGSWLHSPRSVLCLFPDWFGAPQPDWPPQARTIGFPLYDEGDAGLAPEIERFLGEGDPPLVCTAGSAHHRADRFFAECADVCRRLGRRGILVAPNESDVPRPLDPGILHATYAPYPRLFPRAAAVVHHGGIGTSARALAAGVPQLVATWSFDQPDNAARLERLGVARALPASRFTGRRAAALLSGLLGDPEVARACAERREAVAACDTLRLAADHLEALVEGGPAGASPATL